MIKSIKKYFSEIKKKNHELIEKQDNCKHMWVELPIKVELNGQWNIVAFIVGGINTVRIDTYIHKCKKCDKEVSVDIGGD